MNKKKILIIVGIVLALAFVIFAIGKLTKGMRIRSQNSPAIGGPSVGTPDNGQPGGGQGSGQGGGGNNQKGQNPDQELSFLPKCAAGKELFTTFPLKTNDFDSITPLGNLNPSGHTFPTDHIYVRVTDLDKYNYLGNPANRKALLAPADMYITKVSKSEEIGGVADYAMDFSPCQDVLGKFGHIGSLSVSIQNEIAKIDAKCDEYSTGGKNYQSCEYPNIKIKVSAGDEIGGAGDGRSGFLDIWMSDYREPMIQRANARRWDASRNFVSCFLDYYADSQKNQFYDLLHDTNNVTRTKEPRCGTVDVDIAGTAQGVWFYKLQGQVQQEDEHLALAWDNLMTDKQVFSVGTGGKDGGIDTGAYSFTPNTDGTLNRDFSQVTADGAVYCYDTINVNRQSAKKAILLTLPSATKLQLKKASTSTCGTGPWTMGDGLVEYER